MNASHLKKENAVTIFLKKGGARKLQRYQLSFNAGKEIIKPSISKHPEFKKKKGGGNAKGNMD